MKKALHYEITLKKFMENPQSRDVIREYYKKMNDNKKLVRKILSLMVEDSILTDATYITRYYHFTKDGNCIKNGFVDTTEFCGNELPQEKTGCYLLGQTNFNPFTNEKFYWIKVGQAINVKKRMNSYASHSPMVYKIDYLYCDANKLNLIETLCHEELKDHYAISTAQGSKEWFAVSEETYLEICEHKFNWFAYLWKELEII